MPIQHHAELGARVGRLGPLPQRGDHARQCRSQEVRSKCEWGNASCCLRACSVPASPHQHVLFMIHNLFWVSLPTVHPPCTPFAAARVIVEHELFAPRAAGAGKNSNLQVCRFLGKGEEVQRCEWNWMTSTHLCMDGESLCRLCFRPPFVSTVCLNPLSLNNLPYPPSSQQSA